MQSQAEKFESLLEPILDIAYGLAYRMTGNAQDAADLVQEATLYAYKGFHSFELGTNFKAWFLRILTNRFSQNARKQARQPSTTDLDEAPDAYLYQQSQKAGMVDSNDPSALLLTKMDTEQIAKAIEALPEDYRLASTLYFMEDLSYQEIADILDIPLGTVRSRLHRGRNLLQRSLWQVAVENGIVDPQVTA